MKNKIKNFVNILMVVLVLTTLVSFVVYKNQKSKNKLDRTSLHTNPAQQNTKRDRTTRDDDLIPNRSKKTLGQAQSLRENIPTTRLGLELKGTITANDSEPYAVILRIKEKQEVLVKTGDKIGSAKIMRIMSEKVLLLVNGRKELLLLKQKNSQSAPKTQIDVGDSEFDKGFEKIAEITWEDIDRLSENIWDLGKEIRIFPNFDKGKMNGFRISGMKESPFFQNKLGLRNGDIIAGINGKSIQSVKDVPNIYDIFEQLGSTGTIQINIRRDNSPGKINILIE